MKKFLILLIIISVFYFHGSVYATTYWEDLGSSSLFSGQLNDVASLDIDSSGVLYIAFSNPTKSDKVTVMKYNGSSWETVGVDGFSDGGAYSISLKLNSTNVPYVKYYDAAHSGKATVMKYNGTSWENIGTAGFTTGAAGGGSISFDSNDNPYIGFKDCGNGCRATVMKWNGSSWEIVGTSGFSGVGDADYINLKIDSNDTPFIIFRRNSGLWPTVVMKYNGSAWVTVGGDSISGGDSASSQSLQIGSDDVPYIAFSSNDGLKVVKFNGLNWIDVGTSPAYNHFVEISSLALDSGNNLYVYVYDRYSFDNIFNHINRGTVIKWNGDSWELIGQAGGASGSLSYFSNIVLDSNNIPFIATRDADNYTLHIRTTIESRTLYFNAASDHDWDNLDNWWTDSDFTVPATSLPTSIDDVVINAYVNTNSGPDVSVDTMTVSGSAGILISLTVANGAIFNGTSFIVNGRTITGDATFNDQSWTTGTITGNAIFNNAHGGILTITDGLWGGGGSGANIGDDAVPIITWIFNGGSENDATNPITGNVIFNDASQNVESVIVGNVTFNGSSQNGSSSTVTGTAYFLDTSVNLGTIDGDACFAKTAQNLGTVTGKVTVCGASNVVHHSGSSSASMAYFQSQNLIPNNPPVIPITLPTDCTSSYKFSPSTGIPCTTSTNTPPITNNTSCSIIHTLTLWSKGAEVKCLQSKLSLNSDGIFGPKTYITVVAFQKFHNLKGDGVVGHKTLEALK